MFDEPRAEKLLGFYLIINKDGIPRNLPEFITFIKSPQFSGLRHDLVVRSSNPAFQAPKVHRNVPFF
jgi:hypothetical protein